MDFKVLKEYESKQETLILFFTEDLKNEIPELDKEAKTKIDYALKNSFKGGTKELFTINLSRKELPNKIILAGLGKKDEFCREKTRKTAAAAIKESLKLKSETVALFAEDEKYISLIAEVASMATYKFEKYLEKKRENNIKTISVISNSKNAKKLLDEGKILGESTVIAREFVNEPANAMYPETLAARTVELGKEYGFEVEVFEEDKIKEIGMNAFLEVARAAANRPRLIVMRYNGNKKTKDINGLVGKGLTYDSGGYNLKPGDSMLRMKSDMAGSAAVIGAMCAIAGNKLKTNVVAVVAACENMIGGKGYRPGDIIGSMSGKTIFVKSTDAEGRLTLIDAVYYIINNEKVNNVLDIATLTGSASATFGPVLSPYLTNNEEFNEKFIEASKESGEKVWRMPILDEYKEMLKHDEADLTNSVGPQAGMIGGGLFIGSVVGSTPWIHLDIAPTAFTDKESEYISKGGTGVGVRLMYNFIKNI